MRSEVGATTDEAAFLTELSAPVKLAGAAEEDINAALRYCMLKVGIRAQNLPTKEERAVLIDHLHRYYGGHTCQEIRLAFDLSITGKLQVDSRAFESFDCRYVSMVLNAYRKWADGVYENNRRVIELPAPSQDSVDVDWRGLLQMQLDAFFGGKFSHLVLPGEMYDQLVFDGFLHPPDAYEMFQDRAKAGWLHKLQVEASQIKNEWTNENVDAGKYKSVQDIETKLSQIRSGQRDHEIRLLAKQMAIRHYFRYLESKDIKTLYIKDENT